MGKCKGLLGEIALIEVKTRARAALSMAGETSPLKKKIKKMASLKIDHDDEIVNCSSSEVITGTSSCCSSNKNENEIKNQFTKNKRDVVKDCCIQDPEVESGEVSSRYSDSLSTTRRRTSKKGGARLREEGTRSKGLDHSFANVKSTVQIKKMPSDSEIEEFFYSAQREIHKRFTDKYNFDIVKDIPLEGRYEWVQINP